MVVLLTSFIWHWLWSDKSCLLLTWYSGYILQVRWINLWSSDVTFILDSVCQKLLQSANFWLSYFKKIKVARFFGPPCISANFSPKNTLPLVLTTRAQQLLRRATVLPQQAWAESGEGLLWGAGSPSNTMWPGPRPTSLPSGILIHPTVWPQL